MKKEMIFNTEPPFAECHASTVIELEDKGFMTAWFGGTYEKHNDVGIWDANRSPKGKWSKPRLLIKINNQPHWNPVLFRDPHNIIHLFFKVGKGCAYWKTWKITSKDNGETWSKPAEVVPGKYSRGPVKNKCIVLSDGTWLAPSSSEIGRWKAFVDISRDKGKTWTSSKMAPMSDEIIHQDKQGKDIRLNVIQPTLWESAPGKVHMLLRSNCGKICRSDSVDGGQTWCKVYETKLPNNNSGIDMAKLENGTLVLAYNPVSSAWGIRWPIRLVASFDNGVKWTKLCDMDTKPKIEYSYPAVIATSDGGAAVTYTWRRKNIAFVRFSARELKKPK